MEPSSIRLLWGRGLGRLLVAALILLAVGMTSLGAVAPSKAVTIPSDLPGCPGGGPVAQFIPLENTNVSFVPTIPGLKIEIPAEYDYCGLGVIAKNCTSPEALAAVENERQVWLAEADRGAKP